MADLWLSKLASQLMPPPLAAAEDDDPVAWIERNFFIPETANRRLALGDYQKACLREALRKDVDGRFVYSTVVWSDIKKSIKSTIAAAVVLHRAWHTEWGQILIVANDLKQAASRVGYYLNRAIELNPELRSQVKVSHSGTLFTFPLHTTVECVPVDPTGEAGSNADLVVYSELWGAHYEAQKRMWAETTIPPTKFGYSQRWVETYAGYSGESPLLENLYDQGVNQGRQIDDELGIPGLRAYRNEVGSLFCLWNDTPRLPWQTDAYYAEQAATLLDTEFRRVHRNEWVSSQEAFVAPEWWDACYDPNIPPLGERQPIIVALDAAVSDDCFGILATSRRKIGADWHIDVRYARKWQPERGQKLLFSNPNDPEDMNYPEGVIRWLARTYRVEQFAYDPHQLHKFASDLRVALNKWFREFPQGEDRLVADKQLRDLIREQRIHHDGNPDLAEHIKNANAKMDPEGGKLRIVKRSQGLKIDLAVCLSMASAECLRLNL